MSTENHSQVQLTASLTEPSINWRDQDGDLIGVPLEVAEAIAENIGELREQLRTNEQRGQTVAALRRLASWIETAPVSVGAVYGLDSCSVFFTDNDKLRAVVMENEASTDIAPEEFGSGPERLVSRIEFGPISLRLLGQPVEAEVSA